jgi:GxxExxY protein
MTELLHRELTEKIIGVYYDVYNGLSRTYPESIYESAMMRDLGQQRIRCTRQEEYRIFYREWLVGLQRLDIFASETVVVELKVRPYLTRLDQAQTTSYLKVTGQQVGLLFNFGSPEPEFKRVFFTPREGQSHRSPPEKAWPDLMFPELSYQIIGGLFDVHNELGPGFIHRIYANACFQEMQARGLQVRPLREMTVFYRGEPVGKVKLGHLQIEDSIMVFPVAVRDERQIEPENLRRWMASQGISLGILANFHAERLEPIFLKERVRAVEGVGGMLDSPVEFERA